MSGGQGRNGETRESFHWLHKAADGGHTRAQGLLGLKYYEGKEIALDLKAARKYFKWAAVEGDHHDAKIYLGLIYHYGGVGTIEDFGEAYVWYRLAEEDEEGQADYRNAVYLNKAYNEEIIITSDNLIKELTPTLQVRAEERFLMQLAKIQTYRNRPRDWALEQLYCKWQIQ